MKAPRESRNAYTMVTNCFESTEKKEGVLRLIIDVSEAVYLDDELVAQAISELASNYRLPPVSIIDKNGTLRNCT